MPNQLQLKRELYENITSLKKQPRPKWSNEKLLRLRKNYSSELSRNYEYKILPINENIGYIYGINIETEIVERIGLMYHLKIFIISNKYALSSETSIPLRVCSNKPVESVQPMERNDEPEAYAQIERISEFASNSFLDFKEKCYNHAEDICGDDGPCCCYTIFEIMPQVPKMANVILPYAYEKMTTAANDASDKIVDATYSSFLPNSSVMNDEDKDVMNEKRRTYKYKIDGGSTKRRKGTKRKNAKRRKKTTIKHRKRVKR